MDAIDKTVLMARVVQLWALHTTEFVAIEGWTWRANLEFIRGLPSLRIGAAPRRLATTAMTAFRDICSLPVKITVFHTEPDALGMRVEVAEDRLQDEFGIDIRNYH